MTESKRAAWRKESLLEYAKSKGYEIVPVLEDIASGLDENRRPLNKLFDMVEERSIEAVVTGFRDRLTRFGLRHLERYLSSHGVRIEVAKGEKPKDSYQELPEDLTALVSIFA